MQCINYRIWHVHKHKMYTVYKLGWENIEVKIDVDGIEKILVFNRADVIVMRSIDQVDSKGNDIYEGDIIEDGHGTRCEIEKIGHMYCLKDGKECLKDMPFVTTNFTIIGDTFTSPELRPYKRKICLVKSTTLPVTS